jgi:succinoglycan biosynthesis transport protein ExoP
MRAYIHLRDILSILSRRKLFLIVPFIIIAVLGVVGAYVLPERYESYTTIMVQRDKILNPLVQFTMAVQLANTDRLQSFDEIIYSRSAMETLLDSLGMLNGVTDPSKIDEMVEQMRRRISTGLRSSTSLRILVADRDPVMAQRTVTLLAKIYIQMTLRAEQQENQAAVDFFDGKVAEYRRAFEIQQQELLNLQQGRVLTMPDADESLHKMLSGVQEELREVERTLALQERTDNLLRVYADNIDNPGTVSQISALEDAGAVLYIGELKKLSVKYNDLLTRYTPRYPEVQSLRQQLLSLLTKSSEALAADMEKAQRRKQQLTRQRDDIVQTIQRALNLNEVSEERRTSYMMAKKLYDDMSLKLEQARVSKDLGERGASKYVILDPALVPLKPSKPNRPKIIMGAVGVGFVVGIIAVFLSEYLDPTIRRRKDIEVFQKPVIAYLP